jgi:hypothetical protein
MSIEIKDALVEALSGETNEEVSCDELTRDVLVATLEMDKKVFDALNWNSEKKSRGRPRKETILGNGEVCRAEDPSKCWKHGGTRKALIEQAKIKGRNRDRLNPQPTRDLEKELDLDRDLREAGWDIEDSPDSKAETDSMLSDMNNLRREAGLKKLDDSFEPYAAYRKKWEEYGEVKKHAAMLQKQAAISLKKHNYDDVEEMIATLKKKPQEIFDKYKEILEAYDACCEALGDEIERQGRERGIKSPDALEAEKKDYGMMPRETSRDYQKRMRDIGKTKEVPETIKKVDGIVAQTERRWRSVAGMGQEEFGKVKENFRKTFKRLMKGCSLASNLSIAGVNGVLEDHLKSQHDFVKKGQRYDDGNFSHNAIVGGMTDGPRYRFTQKCFGVDKGLKESKYEKYGCLHTLTPADSDNLTGGQYGKNVIRWKPHKTVATMTFTDSLCLARDGLNYVTPCLVTDPSPCCFNPENRTIIDSLKEKPLNVGLEELCYLMGTEYCELQLHGENQYNADAIESISFGSSNDVRNLSKKAIESILANRIPIFIGGKPIRIDENGSIKRDR